MFTENFDADYCIRLYEQKKYKDFYDYCCSFRYIDDAKTLHYLGVCFRYGYGVEKDYDKAVMYHEAAAARNYIPSMYSLGYFYKNEMKPTNIEKSVFWYEKAAENGYADAMYALGHTYKNIHSVKDMNKAFYWLSMAAEQGYSDAMYSLGRMYRDTESIKNMDKAFYWLEKAAEKGDADAMYALGYTYKNYDEVYDIEKSTFWYEKAAEKGYVDAMYALGNTFKNIESVRDYQRAVLYYKMGANNGCKDSKYYFAKLSLECIYDFNPEEVFKALCDGALAGESRSYDLLLSHAEKNSAVAQFFMGSYFTDKGDTTTAYKWYSKAATQGYIPAQNLIMINNSNRTTTALKDIKSDTGIIKETTNINSQKLDVISGKLSNINDTIQNIRTKTFTGKRETAEEEESITINMSATAINTAVKESSKDKIEQQKNALVNLFGEEIWQKLSAESRTSLISSSILLKECECMPPEFDYSGICITAIVALEQELKRLFSDEYLLYLKANFKDEEIPRIFNDPNKKYYFSLGKIPTLFGYDKEAKAPMYNFYYRRMEAYLKTILKPQYAQKPMYHFNRKMSDNCIVARCVSINEKYRKKAAHEGNISRQDAIDCCFEIYGETTALMQARQSTAEVINLLRELYSLIC